MSLSRIVRLDGYIQNTYLAIYPDKLLLLDGCCRADVPMVLDYIKNTLHRPITDLKVVVVTHMHPDFVSEGMGLSTEQSHEFNEVQQQVNKLRDDYKIVINKAYFGGLTQEEIAKELQIPLGTVKTRTRAALIELREILKEFKFIILFFLFK